MELCHCDALWCHYNLVACANHGHPFHTKLHQLLLTYLLNISDATTNRDTPDSPVFHSVYFQILECQHTKLYHSSTRELADQFTIIFELWIFEFI
ncbi:hypothetical protein HanPI659440_Chr04g0157311 [Helianthus annuus]|nr:hypothetical protein HanPI659440_Chr04g0157311 [Helianthus annuus]